LDLIGCAALAAPRLINKRTDVGFTWLLFFLFLFCRLQTPRLAHTQAQAQKREELGFFVLYGSFSMEGGGQSDSIGRSISGSELACSELTF